KRTASARRASTTWRSSRCEKKRNLRRSTCSVSLEPCRIWATSKKFFPMAADRKKPWQISSLGRHDEGVRERRRVLIVCEDTKSSRLYFRAFNIDPERAEVLTVGTG